MTIIVMENQLTNGTSEAISIDAGQYQLGVSGDFNAGTVQLYANLGPAKAVPVTGADFTSAGMEIFWLGSCTVYATVTGAAGATDLSAVLVAVSTKLTRD